MKATIILSDGEVRKAIHEYLVRNGVSDQMAGDVVVQIDTQKDMQRDQWIDIDGDRWRIRAATRGTK